MEDVTAYPHGVLALDSGYGGAGMAAIHFVIHEGEVAIIDTAHNAAVPRVLGALAAAGVAPECVRWVMLTHIHLDHAGGAGSLMCALPNAKLLVHPRGARHMIDPSRLWQSTCEVYGAQKAFELYGRLAPVPQERVVEAVDGMVVTLAGREFEILDTPGHARHHICIYDRTSNAFFTGDTFGVSYRQLDAGGHASVIPATTPTQFDLQAAHRSIDRLLSYQPQAMFLTHYSRVMDVSRLGDDLHRLLDAFVAVAQAARGENEARCAEIRAGLEEIIREEAERQVWPLSVDEALRVLHEDLELNVQGLAFWVDEQRRQAQEAAVAH